jgi:hypothetical protein
LEYIQEPWNTCSATSATTTSTKNCEMIMKTKNKMIMKTKTKIKQLFESLMDSMMWQVLKGK